MNRVLHIATLLATAGCAPPVTERVLRVREDGGVDDDTAPGGRVVLVDPGGPPPPPMPTREAIAALRVFERNEDPRRFHDALAPHLLERRPPARRPLPDRFGADRPRKDRPKEKAARKARKKNRGR